MPYRRFRVKIFEKCHFKLKHMIAKPDHPKRSIKERILDPHYRITEEEWQEYLQSIRDANPNSNLNDDDTRELKVLGRYHYIHRINGELNNEFNVRIVVETEEDFKLTMRTIEDYLRTGEITITINKIIEDWDDIPSPPQEQLEKAIEIANQFKLELPPVPEVEKTNEPSWD